MQNVQTWKVFLLPGNDIFSVLAYRMAYPMHTLQLTIHSTTITLTVKLHQRHLKLHMVTDLDIK